MQVSEDTVRSWLKRKKNRLPSFRAGREFRIKVQDFEQWLQEQQYEEVGEQLLLIFGIAKKEQIDCKYFLKRTRRKADVLPLVD